MEFCFLQMLKTIVIVIVIIITANLSKHFVLSASVLSSDYPKSIFQRFFLSFFLLEFSILFCWCLVKLPISVYYCRHCVPHVWLCAVFQSLGLDHHSCHPAQATQQLLDDLKMKGFSPVTNPWSHTITFPSITL